MNPIESLVNYIETNQFWQFERVFERNEFLVEHGKNDTHLYFIVSGSVRIYMVDGEAEHTIRFGYPGSIIGAQTVKSNVFFQFFIRSTCFLLTLSESQDRENFNFQVVVKFIYPAIFIIAEKDIHPSPNKNYSDIYLHLHYKPKPQ